VIDNQPKQRKIAVLEWCKNCKIAVQARVGRVVGDKRCKITLPVAPAVYLGHWLEALVRQRDFDLGT